MNNFKDFKIGQKGIDVGVKTLSITNKILKEDYSSLRNKMVQNCISIPPNITKISSCSSSNNFVCIEELALSSYFDLKTRCLNSNRIGEYGRTELKEPLDKIQEEHKMIMSFIRFLS